MDLTALIDTYRGPLIGLIASWGVPWGDAAEIAQDSFSEAWLRRQSCRGDWNDPHVFGRWLRGIALNRYRNWARARLRHRLRVITLGPAELELAATSPELQQSEELEALERGIGLLPSKQREVILMHYLEETSVRDVAALLSLTPKAVEGRLFQARRNLHRMLSNESPKTRTSLLCL